MILPNVVSVTYRAIPKTNFAFLPSFSIFFAKKID